MFVGEIAGDFSINTKGKSDSIFARKLNAVALPSFCFTLYIFPYKWYTKINLSSSRARKGASGAFTLLRS